ncbi:MAG: type IV toxin-antitoxin system AbiEi family antitoxin domain-containing protein [Candidatus Nanoarchaeia archaeon]
MKTIKLIEKLKQKAVFGTQDIQIFTRCSPVYAKQIISRLMKNNLIKKIRKNSYTTQTDIFVIASNIIYPSYISFWSCAYYKGYTEQIINTIQVASTIKNKNISFEGYKIKFIKINDFFGYKKIKTDAGELFLAEDEKLLIDCLLRQKECGNFSEIEKIFKNSKPDKSKIIKYLKNVNKQALTKRVGFLLDKINSIDISEEFKLDNNYVILNKLSKKQNKTSTKWRIKYD